MGGKSVTVVSKLGVSRFVPSWSPRVDWITAPKNGKWFLVSPAGGSEIQALWIPRSRERPRYSVFRGGNHRSGDNSRRYGRADALLLNDPGTRPSLSPDGKSLLHGALADAFSDLDVLGLSRAAVSVHPPGAASSAVRTDCDSGPPIVALAVLYASCVEVARPARAILSTAAQRSLVLEPPTL